MKHQRDQTTTTTTLPSQVEQSEYTGGAGKEDVEAGARIDCATLRREVERLTKARREFGISRADAEWVEQPFEDWLAALQGTAGLPRQSIVELGAGMSLSLAMRDALILSLVACRDSDSPPMTKQLMVSFAARPHDPGNVASMSSLLSRAFEDEHANLDMERCGRGIETLRAMICALPPEYCVQPLAVSAYIAWWMGDDMADEYAMSALQLDMNCTLAAIVRSALGHEIWPAWQRQF